MRVAQLLLCPVFLWFAFLQLNDPDAHLWVLAYGLVAATCAAGALRRQSAVACLLLTVVLLTWAAILSMDVSELLVKPEAPSLSDSEEARELTGLLLGAAWCAISGGHAARQRWKKTE